MTDLLKELCCIKGVSGNEESVCEFAAEKLSAFADVSITNDNSVIAVIEPKDGKEANKHILFDAHIDQIGLIVTSVYENGFIKFDTCGGFDPRILYGSDVIVHGKEDFTGVICSTPPHLMKNKDKGPLSIDDMFIDIGCHIERIEEKIRLGDRVSFNNGFYELLNGNIASPATDDRSGVYILIKLAEKLKNEKLSTKFTFLLSSREEIGKLGAQIGAYKIMPDEAISLDVSFAKQPEVVSDRHCILGKGPMIGIAPSLSHEITDLLKKIAQEENIPHQLEVMGGKSGTNADSISLVRGGIPCGLVSIPQRYMHTGVEVVNYSDLENIIELLFNYAKRGGVK